MAKGMAPAASPHSRTPPRNFRPLRALKFRPARGLHHVLLRRIPVAPRSLEPYNNADPSPLRDGRKLRGSTQLSGAGSANAPKAQERQYTSRNFFAASSVTLDRSG